ncbi:MAG: hypothetical protein HC831_05080 [Chloroflexia bacterium]|nr:hypothetical protein [Chloroflexia bacterium]
MKCDECKLLIDKLIDDNISSLEQETLMGHSKKCKNCNQEYKAALNYKLLLSGLLKATPVLENKNEFIDNVFSKLSNTNKETKTIKLWFVDSGFCKTIASIAALLVLFFMVQQTHDAWLVKKLEEKVAVKHVQVNYSQTKEQTFIEFLAKIERNKEIESPMPKWKILFLKKSIAK